MIWIVFTFLMALLAIGSFGTFWFWKIETEGHLQWRRDFRAGSTENQPEPDAQERNALPLLGVGAAVLLWVLISGAMSFTQINAGHRGVVKSFGKVEGEIDPGVTFIAPWKTVATLNVQVQKQQFENISAFSQETQNALIDATLNYTIDPNQVKELVVNVGTNYFEKLVPSRMNQTFKDETVKYPAVQIAPHREEIRKAVVERLGTELAVFGIHVVDLNIDDITFSKQFEDAIERKQEATQEAQRAEQQVKQAQFQAQSEVAKAEGDSKATVARATGQAEANRKLTASLTPEVIQYAAINKLNPRVQVIYMPAGSKGLFSIPGAK